MTYTATITSKNQITLPIGLVREYKLSPGDKLIFALDKNKKEIKIKRSLDILNELSGSVKLPKKYQHLNPASLRQKAITDHFRKRVKRYLP